MSLNKKQLDQCESSEWDFSDLNAMFGVRVEIRKRNEVAKGIPAFTQSILPARGGSSG
jgi:hypothetical protein